jgi:hypothetical protein
LHAHLFESERNSKKLFLSLSKSGMGCQMIRKERKRTQKTETGK